MPLVTPKQFCFPKEIIGDKKWWECFSISVKATCNLCVLKNGENMVKNLLVGGDWNMDSIFAYIGKNTPNWRTHRFFRGVGTPPTRSQWVSVISIFIRSFSQGGSPMDFFDLPGMAFPKEGGSPVRWQGPGPSFFLNSFLQPYTIQYQVRTQT